MVLRKNLILSNYRVRSHDLCRNGAIFRMFIVECIKVVRANFVKVAFWDSVYTMPLVSAIDNDNGGSCVKPASGLREIFIHRTKSCWISFCEMWQETSLRDAQS